MNNPILSVIIITLNEQFLLPQLLESIKRQSFKDYEIIVADYNSTDRTREIARKYGCKIVLGGSYSVGRNRGARIAKADYLLFLDADCLMPKDFLEINFKEFKKSKKGIATTEVKPLSNRLFDKLFFKLYDYWSRIMSYFSPHCCGGSIFVIRKIFTKEGGFNEDIIFAENHEISKKIGSKYGFKILPIPIYTSVRRLDKEGRIKFVIKYIYAGIYRLFYKEIKKEIFEYE